LEPGKDTVNGLVISAFPGPAAVPPGHVAVALGAVEAPREAVPGLKRSLGLPGQPPFPPTLLKASEDQTVLALAAVARALEVFGLHGEPLTGWGVVAAPRSLGRLAAAEALYKFEQGGALKVSPFVVPHHSLHSVSGTVSQAFRMYGPNFGVGGNGAAVVEGLLAALAILDEGRVPGLWLILSECDPEPVPGRDGAGTNPVVYRALALALRPTAAGRELLRLRLVQDEANAAAAPAAPPTVAELIRFLSGGTQPGMWTCPLGWGAWLEMTRSAAAAEAFARAPTRHVA
jgi:hypothetical protein